MTLLETLKRKYGGSIPEVIAFGERAAERMRKIEGRDAELERLAEEIGSARKALERAAAVLRKARQTTAPKLAKNVRQQLVDLGFRQAEFEARLSPNDEPRLSGTEAVELLFSPESGRAAEAACARSLPAAKFRASCSRSSLPSPLQDAIPLLVFDEIDANVGGEIANAVGAKMARLAGTAPGAVHHPSPAGGCGAATHFVVTKEVAQGRTFSGLHEVKGKARQEEIARMLGGRSESALARSQPAQAVDAGARGNRFSAAGDSC